MRFEKPRTPDNRSRVYHSWHEAYVSALRESDPGRLTGRISYAISAIERRYSQWANDPGTPAELKAIQKCISALERLTKERQTGCIAILFSSLSEIPQGMHDPL